ncbi:hypothetical protein [Penaeicola halotolerans]|uniref:hypothetical protein n=1 Tax=Penaeicola halotolerans TaxID=2793196 RepID=UPI001CF8F4A2|nr:hypothetical protein [Penaeicola halotolerans]
MKSYIKPILKINILILLFLALSVHSYAQSSKKNSPITVDYGLFKTKYLYENHVFESPYALQIPLLEIKDENITRNFNRFKKNARTTKILKFVASAISLYGISNQDNLPSEVYWSALGASTVASIFFDIRASRFLDKAIRRYNNQIVAPEIGFQFENFPNGNGMLKFGITQRF